MEGGTAFIVGKATEDAIMHIGKGVANFGVANLDYVDVDGKRLDPQFYTAKDGSILITVHQAYLNTLSVGEHILTAHLEGAGIRGTDGFRKDRGCARAGYVQPAADGRRQPGAPLGRDAGPLRGGTGRDETEKEISGLRPPALPPQSAKPPKFCARG